MRCGRQRIEVHDPLHDRSAAEIENDHRHHGRNEVRRVDFAEFAFRDSFVQQLAHPLVDRLKVGLDQAVDVLGMAFARPHHLALHQLGINLVRGDEIEIRAHVGHDLFARRQVAVEHLENACLHPGKRVVEHRAVERFLVLEVVIEQRLVDARLARDGVGAGSGNAVLGKLLRRRLQDGGAAFLRLPAGTHAGRTMAMTKELHSIT